MSSPSSDEETEAQRVELLRHTAGLTLKVESRRPGSQAGRLPAHCVGSQREEGIVAGPQGGSKFILRYIILFPVLYGGREGNEGEPLSAKTGAKI